MRKKAEKQIREAVRQVGDVGRHRLDKVRGKAGLHPKVFDKTILDMERVGTIALFTEGAETLSPEEQARLVRRGDTVYVSFEFIDTPQESPRPVPAAPSAASKPATIETIVVILQNLLPGEWESFEARCRTEGKATFEKVEELVRAYLYQRG